MKQKLQLKVVNELLGLPLAINEVKLDCFVTPNLETLDSPKFQGHNGITVVGW